MPGYCDFHARGGALACPCESEACDRTVQAPANVESPATGAGLCMRHRPAEFGLALKIP
jgi:hypothetical protein